MIRRHWLFALICAVALLVAVSAQERGGAGKVDPALWGPPAGYDLVDNWLKPVEEGYLIHGTSVFADTPNRIIIALAGVTPKATAPKGLGSFDFKVPGAKVDHQLFVANRNGEIVERWTQWEKRIGSIHKVSSNPYDPEKHIWVVDRGSQQVLKFTNDGKKLVMAVGTEGEGGSDDKHFAQPSDIAFLPDGTFFVGDGDEMVTSMKGREVKVTNQRVVKFDKNGKFLRAWNTGTPGQAIHTLAVDARRRVYVGSRGKNPGKITIFDENGKRLDEWAVDGPSRLWITDDAVWLAAGKGLIKYDFNGKRLLSFGTDGDVRGLNGLSTPHDFSVDSEGNLYTQPASVHVIRKYVPKKNADRSQLVGQRVGAKGTSTSTR